MARPRIIINDLTLKSWLETNFKSKATKNVYASALRGFKKTLGINDLGEYLQDSPDVETDLRKFLNSLDGRPSMTIASYTCAVRVFLSDHDIEVNGNGWKKLRRRGFYPKRIRATTQDKKPTKKELKRIVSYAADIKAKALFLFLGSSGCRIGETLKLEVKDFNLEADPPRAFIRAENTKAGVGERTVYMSYEARDALKNWLAVKDSTMRRDGKGTYESLLMFPFSHATALIMWNNATTKAGLDQTDRRTKRKIYHLHSLRKFFRTQIGLDLDVIHALMGHSAYLDSAYLRQDGEEIAQTYLEAMPNVSVYETQNSETISALIDKVFKERFGVTLEEFDRGRRKDEELRQKTEMLLKELERRGELVRRPF